MRPRDTLELLALSGLWGASFMFMRIAAPEFGPLALVEIRVAIAAAVLTPILILDLGYADMTRHWKKLVLLGTINTAIPFLLFTFSTLYITAGFAGILNATAPIFTALIAWFWLSDRMNASRVAGLLVGAAGVYVLVRDEVGSSFGDSQLAIMAAVLACFFYGLSGNYAKRHMQEVRPLAVAAGTQIGAAIILLPGAVLTWPAGSVSPAAWAAAIVMGIFSTGVAYILYFRLIANVGPTNAITVTYLIPVFAMILGAIVIDEPVTLTMVVGCAIILLGTALATGMLKLPASRR